MNGNETLLAWRESFVQFGEHFIAGLAPRVEHEVSTEGPEIVSSDVSKIASEVADGALLARVIWGGEEGERTGCFLWTGAVSALLGDDDRKVAELSDSEVATVDASLKLSIEEGGDQPPLDWSGLEPIASQDIAAKLREIGIAEQFDCARLPVTLGERNMVFLFLVSNGETSGEQPSPSAEPEAQPEGEPEVNEEAAAEASPSEEDAARGQYVGTPAEPSESAEDDPVASAAAAAMDAATSLAERVDGEEEREEAAPAPAPGRGELRPEHLQNLEHLLDVRLPLTIRLGATRMALEELLALTPGAILELDRREDEPLELLANGQVVGRGEVVVVDERFGLRITEIGSREERARATL